MSKHWNYEDNHDLDDNYDHAANGYVYWYGNRINLLKEQKKE